MNDEDRLQFLIDVGAMIGKTEESWPDWTLAFSIGEEEYVQYTGEDLREMIDTAMLLQELEVVDKPH